MSDRESGDDQPQGQSKYHGQSGGMDAPGSSDFDSGRTVCLQLV